MIMPGLCSCIFFNEFGRCSHRVIKGNLKTQCLRKATYKIGNRRLCEFHQREYLNHSLVDSETSPSTSGEHERKNVVLRPSVDIASESQSSNDDVSENAGIRASIDSETCSTSN